MCFNFSLKFFAALPDPMNYLCSLLMDQLKGYYITIVSD